MSAPVLRPLSAGEVLDVSFGLYRAHFVSLVTVAAIARVVPDSLSIFVEMSGGIMENLALGAFATLLSLVLSMIGVGATTSVVSNAYLGRSIHAFDAVQKALGMIKPLLVVSLASSILIFAGLILLLIPGMIAFSGLALASVVVVLEGKPGLDAMSRSWALTKGFRRKVFFVISLTILFLVVPMMVIGVASAMTGAVEKPGIGMMVASSVLSLFIFPFIYVTTVVLYYDIRVRKEGFDLELLAADLPAA